MFLLFSELDSLPQQLSSGEWMCVCVWGGGGGEEGGGNN